MRGADRVDGVRPPASRKGDVCGACGGSGLRADEIEREFGPGEITEEEREQLDSTRCHTCDGSGFHRSPSMPEGYRGGGIMGRRSSRPDAPAEAEGRSPSSGVSVSPPGDGTRR